MATQTKMQTKLSAKLRRFLKDADEATAARINFQADTLDFAKASMGSMLGRGQFFHDARRLYCELSGKAWDWETEDDLQDIPVPKAKNA